MDQRIPIALRPKFESYLSLINKHLPDFLHAFYIVGSIALDEFNPDFSDVDFVAVVNHLATSDEIPILRKIHKDVERQHSRWSLSGMYLLGSELGKHKGEMEHLLGFHDDRLRIGGNFELNPITWWILKNHGIPIVGPDPSNLLITVDSKILIAWTHDNMNTYWKSWAQRPGRRIALLTDWGIQWAVLGILRQVYTIREGKIIAKQRAGQYGLSSFPPEWHRIINEALRIRIKARNSLYWLRFSRMVECVRFINYAINSSNDSLRKP